MLLLLALAGGLVFWSMHAFEDGSRAGDTEFNAAEPDSSDGDAPSEPPPPAFACRLRGLVRAGGTPVAGARVLLIPPRDIPDGLFLARLTGRLLETDPAGRFQVDIDAGERCLLRIVAPEGGGIWRDVRWSGRGADRDIVIDLPETAARTLSIEPPNAEVFVLAKGRRMLPLRITRARAGKVTVPLSDDDLVLVRAKGRAAYAGPPQDTIRLGPAFRIAGVAVDESGRIVRAATVLHPLAEGVHETVLTDLDGRFTLDGLPAKRTALFVTRAGFASTLARVWPGDENLRIRLAHVRPTRGTVVDAANKPVADAAILIDGTQRATTGKDGKFRIDDTPGGVAVHAQKDGMKASATAFRGPVELVLRRPESIAVRLLTSQGLPVPGLSVRGFPGVSDAKGHLTVPRAAAGQPAYGPRALAVRVAAGTVTVPDPVVTPLPLPRGARVRLDPGDGWWDDGKLYLHPTPTGARFLYVSVPGRGAFFEYPYRGGKIELTPFATLRGRVQPGATVGWGKVARTRADADGRFALEDLRQGRRTLWMKPDGQQRRQKRRRDGDVLALRVVALKPGGDVDLGEIDAAPTRTRRGRVTNAADAPIGGARVRPLSDIDLPFTLTRADGSYELRTSHAGPLLVEREGYAPTPTKGGSVILNPGGTVSLQVTFGNGPTPRWTALLAYKGMTVVRRRGKDRRLKFDGLPPGEFELGVRIGQKTVWHKIEVRDGETKQITVDPTKPGTARRDGS